MLVQNYCAKINLNKHTRTHLNMCSSWFEEGKVSASIARRHFYVKGKKTGEVMFPYTNISLSRNSHAAKANRNISCKMTLGFIDFSLIFLVLCIIWCKYFYFLDLCISIYIMYQLIISSYDVVASYKYRLFSLAYFIIFGHFCRFRQ